MDYLSNFNTYFKVNTYASSNRNKNTFKIMKDYEK